MPNRKLRVSALRLCCLGLLFAGCASTPAAETRVYAMPPELGLAMRPADADPSAAGELAESALHMLDPGRPSGPDYVAATRMCMLAIEVADPVVERDLIRACYRVAARSALRSGDRQLYVDAVGAWERQAPRNERAAGELAIHMAIRDRLENEPLRGGARIPPDVRRLLPAKTESR